MDDRRRETDPGWSGRYEAPVGRVGRGTSILPWLGVVVAALIVAITKPWGPPVAGPSPSVVGSAGSMPSAVASSSSLDAAGLAGDPALVGICHNTDAWLLATVEVSRGQKLRILRVLDPGPGTVPAGQAVPRVVFGSERVLDLGWCAPVVGPGRSSGITSVTAVAVRGGQARAIALAGDRAFASSVYGILYRPPAFDPAVPRILGVAASTPGTWATGVYVFTLTDATGARRSFAFDLEILPPEGPPVTRAPTLVVPPVDLVPDPSPAPRPRPPQDRGQATR